MNIGMARRVVRRVVRSFEDIYIFASYAFVRPPLALASLALASYARAPASRASVRERDLQSQVMTLLELHGWLAYHTFDSRRSAPGFPDIVAVKGRRLLVLELKTDTGKVTTEQHVWLAAFAGVDDVDVCIVRPADSLDELEALVAW